MTDEDSFVGSALAEKEMDSTVEVKANASESNIGFRDCRYNSETQLEKCWVIRINLY